MKELILEKKKAIFDNAIKTYLDFKKELPMNNKGKIDFTLIDNVQYDKYKILINDIWLAKDNYQIELNNQYLTKTMGS